MTDSFGYGDALADPVDVALRRMGIGRTQFYKEVNSGRLTICKVGKKRTLVERSEQVRWLASCRVKRP